MQPRLTQPNADTSKRALMASAAQPPAAVQVGQTAALYTRDGLPIALLTVPQAAAVAGCGKTTLREEIASGRIVARKIGKALRVDAGSLLAWVNTRPVARLRPDVRGERRAA